ncbi:transmembrane channel-like protein 8 isoform 2-T2 [Discoglossus pictus]
MCLVLTGGFLIIPILLSEEEVSPDLSELQCGRPPPPRNLSQVTFLDFFTGEGFLENSYLFYGFYTEQKMQLSWINIPLAYLLIPFVYLLLCTLSLVKHTVHGLTLRRVWRRDYRTRISSKVFAGWDSCVRGAGTALLKQQSLSNEFKSHLAEDRWFLDIACLSFHRRLYILVTRVLLNCVILAMMAGGFYSIHLATGVSQDYQVRAVDPVLSLVIQYLVPIVISLVLTILPHIFMLIGKYEGHSPNDEITLALIRCVFLRLGTLAIFLFSLAQKILCLGSSRPSCEACGYNENFQCWETTVGQEFYKLSMFHFLRVLAEFLLLQIPRRFLVSRSQCCLVRWLGQEKFQLSQNVLDMVYEQTLVWGGLFYAPLLPLFNIIFIFIIFYIKKFSLYRLCDVSQRLFRDSASRILFHFVLLLGLMTVFLPLIYMVTRVRPSRSCGPFTEYSTAWEVLQNSTRSALPPSVMKTLDIITSHLFGYALIMFLSLLLTSCISRVRQYEDIIEHWKEYLSYQIQDKIFLIKRLREQQSLTSEIPTEESCNWQDLNTLASCDPNSLSIEALYDLHSPANNTLCDQNSPSIEALCERNSPSTGVLQDLQSLPTEQSCKWQSPTVPLM